MSSPKNQSQFDFIKEDEFSPSSLMTLPYGPNSPRSEHLSPNSTKEEQNANVEMLQDQVTLIEREFIRVNQETSVLGDGISLTQKDVITLRDRIREDERNMRVTEGDVGRLMLMVNSAQDDIATLQTKITTLRMRLEISEQQRDRSEQYGARMRQNVEMMEKRLTELERNLVRMNALENAITGMAIAVTRINYN